MFKTNYDTDITTWSPAGRLYQVEYANEAVKQGSSTVAVKSRDFVVLAALKRSPTAELSSYQEKVFKLNEYLGMSLTGLVNDGRSLSRFLRTESMNYEYMFNDHIPVPKIIDLLSEKLQRHTQDGHKRPFGVGLLFAGYNHIIPSANDELNAPDNALTTANDIENHRNNNEHIVADDNDAPKGTAYLYQTSPSAEVHRVVATAIGSRSQSARTYLEKYHTTFRTCPREELVLHALKSLSLCSNPYDEDDTNKGDTDMRYVKLTTLNTTIAIVGVDTPFSILDDGEVKKYIDKVIIRPEDRALVEEEDENVDEEDGVGRRRGENEQETGRPMDLED